MRAEFPEGFALRPPEPPDGDAIVAMMNEESVALRGYATASLDWVVTGWTAPGADRENDYVVVTGPDGDMAGYFFVESHPPHTEVFSVGVVAMRHHGRGIGAAIVEEAERRARRFFPLAPPGARIVMHAGALAEEPRVDERIAYDCLSEAFADHWGDTWQGEDAWLHDHIHASTEFQPDLWQLAWHGAELAGILIALPAADGDATLGHVSSLGVRRAYRRRGIGEALLRTSFAQFRDRGYRGVVLEVDTESVTGATRLYTRLGMTSEPRFSQWEKELRPGDA
jgi:mycothiol synthase